MSCEAHVKGEFLSMEGKDFGLFFFFSGEAIIRKTF